MLLGRYTQGPGENLKRELDYTAFLEAFETITAVVATVDPDDGAVPLIVDPILVDPAGLIFGYFVSGGEDGTDYTVTFGVTTSTGQVLNDQVEFDIEV